MISELASRKILEELQQQKKQLLLKQGVVSSSLNSSLPPVIGSSNSGNFENHSNAMQRAALQQANTQSMGNFITQDSSFGNLILPVIPRFETK